VEAAVVAASLSSSLRLHELTVQTRSVVETIDTNELDIRGESKLLLAKAMTNYHARENQNGLPAARTAAQLLRAAGATDTTFVQIHVGLGAIACASGAMVDAIEPLETAFQAASRLDNSPLMDLAALNLTLCHRRLGHPQLHETWASTTWRLSKHTPPGSYERLHAAANCALAQISLGQPSRAIEALGWLKTTINEVSLPWVRQAGFLYVAEVLWLLGDQTHALAAVEEARKVSTEALTIGLVGSFVTWSVRLLLRRHDLRKALSLAERWYQELDRLDLIDKVEVLLALAEIRSRMATSDRHLTERALTLIATLPIGYSQQFSQLGLLPDGGP
jgi:tetratricopeptide (TPR) repeat protein